MRTAGRVSRRIASAVAEPSGRRHLTVKNLTAGAVWLAWRSVQIATITSNRIHEQGNVIHQTATSIAPVDRRIR